MQIEREKTYLIKNLPKSIELGPPTLVEDYYLPAGSEHPKLRIRRKGDRFEITKKTPIDGDVSRQLEQTIPISEAEFMELTSGLKRKVAKNRYTVENEGRTAEIDIFIGEHEGLILCDFEFETDEELHNFKTPDFVLADVTTEDIIAGGILSGTTRDELFEILSEKYGL